ncbi:MAG: ImmA/IrrE family metallo-endopeptidase [Bilophila wadsworthia]
MDEWLECTAVEPEISATFGKLYFAHGNIEFTSHRNGASYCSAAYLPAYPLALWIAQSWWRLFYELKPNSNTYEWSATHCMRFAGHGFLWPDVWLQTDGVFMDILARPYVADEEEPIEYFPHESRGVPLDRMETCFSRFMDKVIERLDRTEPNLEKLWREVLHERQDDALFNVKLRPLWGMIEMNFLSRNSRFDENGQAMGNSLLEALAAFRQSGETHDNDLKKKFSSLSSARGVQGRFDLPVLPHDTPPRNTLQPWDLGRNLAHQLRKQAGITGKIDNKMLGDMLGLNEKNFNSLQPETEAPFSFGTKNADSYTFTFLKERIESKRFQAARFIGDYCTSQLRQQDDKWLILSDSSTFRQKAQRAFGAELLMPVDLITEHTGGNYTQANVKKVAAEFEVSPVLAATQLANHKLISPAEVELYSYASGW